jgi:hypothetical protein
MIFLHCQLNDSTGRESGKVLKQFIRPEQLIKGSNVLLVPPKASFIYCENYGLAGAITIIGKKYGLPEAVCFSESFRYWIPRKFNPDIKSFIYINDKPGEDIKNLFGKISLIGRISNRDAREYGTAVYLCEFPKTSFNEFWSERISRLD